LSVSSKTMAKDRGSGICAAVLGVDEVQNGRHAYFNN
jgi:hypothetical protein